MNTSRFYGIIFALSIATGSLTLAHEHGDSAQTAGGKESLDASASKEVTGEIVDLMCYIDHAAMGDKHAGCGSKCIEGGGPVGIVENGKAYLVVGEHRPINEQLADSCGKTVTLKGKVAERGGMTLLENAEVVKK
jgi:hypothetical protein